MSPHSLALLRIRRGHQSLGAVHAQGGSHRRRGYGNATSPGFIATLNVPMASWPSDCRPSRRPRQRSARRYACRRLARGRGQSGHCGRLLAVGFRRSAAVLSPSWPKKLSPQQRGPALVSAHVMPSPATTSASVAFATGLRDRSSCHRRSRPSRCSSCSAAGPSCRPRRFGRRPPRAGSPSCLLSLQ